MGLIDFLSGEISVSILTIVIMGISFFIWDIIKTYVESKTGVRPETKVQTVKELAQIFSSELLKYLTILYPERSEGLDKLATLPRPNHIDTRLKELKEQISGLINTVAELSQRLEDMNNQINKQNLRISKIEVDKK